MDTVTIETLRRLDNAFYRDNAASFSQTRQHAWPGWERVMASLPRNPESVLDVACGNARFKSFADSRVSGGVARYHAVDSCSLMFQASHGARFQTLDIIEALQKGTLDDTLEAPACDLVVCFGFMHHVPTRQLRLKLLDTLIEKTKVEGTLACSFWRFADDPKMREKALAITEIGRDELGVVLEADDYLLGWNDVRGAYRYCHSFNDDEIDEFASRGKGDVKLVDRFNADGRTGEMNCYLVMRKLV